MEYLILLKQLSPEDLEAKLINRGLSKISPMALMNFLRIFMLHLKDFRWKNGKIPQNIPEINADEWPQILSHCTKQEFLSLINLNGDPKAAMPNQATGQKTPVQEYYQNLNNSFEEKVRGNLASH